MSDQLILISHDVIKRMANDWIIFQLSPSFHMPFVEYVVSDVKRSLSCKHFRGLPAVVVLSVDKTRLFH